MQHGGAGHVCRTVQLHTNLLCSRGFPGPKVRLFEILLLLLPLLWASRPQMIPIALNALFRCDGIPNPTTQTLLGIGCEKSLVRFTSLLGQGRGFGGPGGNCLLRLGLLKGVRLKFISPCLVRDSQLVQRNDAHSNGIEAVGLAKPFEVFRVIQIQEPLATKPCYSRPRLHSLLSDPGQGLEVSVSLQQS